MTHPVIYTNDTPLICDNDTPCDLLSSLRWIRILPLMCWYYLNPNLNPNPSPSPNPNPGCVDMTLPYPCTHLVTPATPPPPGAIFSPLGVLV